MPRPNTFDCLIAECSGGVMLYEAAQAAYALTQQTGIPVRVKHNDRIYDVTLETREVGQDHKQ